MNTWASLFGGAVTITEQGGVVKLNFNDSGNLGGGNAAGWLQVSGQASVVLNGKQDFDLLASVIEAHSPSAIVPLEQAGQAAVDAGIAAT